MKYNVVLILSGGNALGAFEAGVYQTLHEHDLLPNWVIGTSVGAINGALIVGAQHERRVENLRAFWRVDDPDADRGLTAWWPAMVDDARRTAAVSWTMLTGRTGLFGPLLSAPAWNSDRRAIFDTGPLKATLQQQVDFALLNKGECRFSVTAVDLASGDDAVFDTKEQVVGPDHIRASAALPVTFPPIEIDGRWFVDGGLSANLALDPFFADAPQRPTLCIAVDLLPLAQALPRSLGEAASRMQDLIFAAQSRRSVERWRAAYVDREDVSISLVRLTYKEQTNEVAGKAMDFSTPTIAERWEAGQRACEELVKQLDGNCLSVGEQGLHVSGF